MAGIEIAGLVLGAFPLLVSAAEHYKEGWQPLIKWKRFRTEFLGFIDAIDIEKQLFDQMLERFLISADVPQEELRRFLEEPRYEGWNREDLAIALKSRLGASHAAFMSSIKTMNVLMGELENMLAIKNGQFDWADEGSSSWDYQLKRIRHSFSKKGSKNIGLLEKHNRKLRELLDSTDKLDSMKAVRKDTTWARVFECIRNHARSLHTAVKDGWNCDCSIPHSVGLRLQQRKTGDWSSSFILSFEPPQAALRRRELVASVKIPNGSDDSLKLKTQSINQTQSKDQNNSKMYVQSSTHNQWHNRKSSDAQSQATIQIFQTNTNNQLHPTAASGRDTLRRNFEFESKSSLEVCSTTRPILAPLSPSQSCGRDSVSRSRSDSGIYSTSSQVQVVVDDTQKKWLSGIRSKVRKTVRMDVPIAVGPIDPIDAANLSVQLQQLQTNNFADPSITPPSTPEPCSDIKIEDLCRTIHLTSNQSLQYVGYLPDNEQRYHELRTLDSNSEYSELVSLEAILTSPAHRLKRHDRYKIATILASSVLQLQETPWLVNGKLRKQDIYFRRNANQIAIDQPYVALSFPSRKAQTSLIIQSSSATTSPVTAVKKTLNYLGILLLELCFGEPIEKQAIRESYFVDGKAHANTDFLTALEWADMVCEEEPALERVIKCCVCCIFEEKANWQNPKFTQAVYASVVEPLEQMIQKWSGI